MEIKIGKFIVSKRTPYSKLQLFDKETGENITDLYPRFTEKIFDDYVKQTEHPEYYFKIEGTELVEVHSDYAKTAQALFIPEGVKTIKARIFANAFADIIARQIHLPESLEEIGNYAFRNCCFLESIYIPDNVVKMGEGAFMGCSNLQDVKLSSRLEYINFRAFSECSSLENINFPDSILYVGTQSFSDCKNLKTVRLHKNFKSMADGAFSGCESLSEIDLPEGLETIGPACFKDCKSLREVILPDSITQIYQQAFMGCESLECIGLSNNITKLCRGAFSDCEKLRSLVLPDSITTIEEGVFNNTHALEKISLPRNLQSIGTDQFYRSGVHTLEINHNIKNLEIYRTLFGTPSSSCSNLTLINGSKINKLTIDKSVKKISKSLLCDHGGEQITKIDFLGTKEEYEKFKKSNKKFFSLLPNIKEVNFVEEEYTKTNLKEYLR